MSEEILNGVGIPPVGSDAGEAIPVENAEFQMPTKEELLGMLDSMGLGDAEKEELRSALMGEAPLGDRPSTAYSSQGFVLLAFLLLIASIFAFFGYKLYKSLKDKEVKREEKKKLKQLKKKK